MNTLEVIINAPSTTVVYIKLLMFVSARYDVHYVC